MKTKQKGKRKGSRVLKYSDFSETVVITTLISLTHQKPGRTSERLLIQPLSISRHKLFQ